MSEQLQHLAERKARSRHKNQLKFVREDARQRAAQVLKELSDPKPAAHLKNNLYSDRALFVPRQSHTERTKNDFRPRTPSDFQLERKRAAVVSLDRRITSKRATLREVHNGKRLAPIFRFRQPRWLRLMQQAQTTTLFRELRELQQARYQLLSDYRAARRRLIPGPAATRTVPSRKKSKASAPTITPVKTKPTLVRTKPVKPSRPGRGI